MRASSQESIHRRIHSATGGRAHYGLSGGPIMQISHSNGFDSSTSPAENPSTGFLFRSVPEAGEGYADTRRAGGRTRGRGTVSQAWGGVPRIRRVRADRGRGLGPWLPL